MHIYIVIRRKVFCNKNSHNLSMLLTTKDSFLASTLSQIQNDNNETTNSTTKIDSSLPNVPLDSTVVCVTFSGGVFGKLGIQFPLCPDFWVWEDSKHYSCQNRGNCERGEGGWDY